MDTETLLESWLTNLESGCSDEHTNDAFVQMAFLEPVSDPETAWLWILEGVRRARSDEVLGLIGASTLENFLSNHGSLFIDRVEHEAKTDPKFRMAVRHVWKYQMGDDVWDRVKALQGESS